MGIFEGDRVTGPFFILEELTGGILQNPKHDATVESHLLRTKRAKMGHPAFEARPSPFRADSFLV
jgi:hypothetical protein